MSKNPYLENHKFFNHLQAEKPQSADPSVSIAPWISDEFVVPPPWADTARTITINPTLPEEPKRFMYDEYPMTNSLNPALISIIYEQWEENKGYKIIDDYIKRNEEFNGIGFFDFYPLGYIKPNVNPDTGEPDPEHYGYRFQPRYDGTTGKEMSIQNKGADINEHLVEGEHDEDGRGKDGHRYYWTYLNTHPYEGFPSIPARQHKY